MSSPQNLLHAMEQFYYSFPYVIEATSMDHYFRSKEWATAHLGQVSKRDINEEGRWTTFGLSVRLRHKTDYIRMRLSLE